ncbi:hypothetical protein Plhal304r1_c023g0080531 [Plasmopara halstedii]
MNQHVPALAGNLHQLHGPLRMQREDTLHHPRSKFTVCIINYQSYDSKSKKLIDYQR